MKQHTRISAVIAFCTTALVAWPAFAGQNYPSSIRVGLQGAVQQLDLLPALNYFNLESDGQIRFAFDQNACNENPPAVASDEATVCLIMQPELEDTGHAQAHGNHWQLAIPRLAFFAHELGHLFGFVDLYNPEQAPESRQSGTLMGWISDRPHSLALWQLRQHGWARIQTDPLGTEETVLLRGEQARICQGTECYTIGLHYKHSNDPQYVPLRLEAEWTRENGDGHNILAFTTLQQRILQREAQRGEWQIPQGVLPAGKDLWFSWQYIPQPHPRVVLQFKDFIVPEASSLQQASTAATESQAVDPTNRGPLGGLPRSSMQYILYGIAILFVLAGLWGLKPR